MFEVPPRPVFRTFKMAFHCTLVCIVFDRDQLSFIEFSSGVWHFSLAALKIISLSLGFSSLTMIRLVVIFFVFIYLEIMEFLEYLSWCFSSYLRNLDHDLKFFFLPHSPFWTPITHTLDYFICSRDPPRLCSFDFNLVFSVFSRLNTFYWSVFKLTDSLFCHPQSDINSTQWIFYINYCNFLVLDFQKFYTVEGEMEGAKEKEKGI